MHLHTLVGGIEALLFATATPLTESDLRRIFLRWDAQAQAPSEGATAASNDQLREALATLRARWQNMPPAAGFCLVEVAEGLAFRTHPDYAGLLAAMQATRTQRLSRAALETLAIVAYKQPVTKVEADHIRGVDCGGTLKILLDRQLIAVIGKKEEPGRPLIYGTGAQFLNFFNLQSMQHLPSLRSAEELVQDADAGAEEPALSLQELRRAVADLQPDPGIETQPLEAAMDGLAQAEGQARSVFAAEGIVLSGNLDGHESGATSAGAQAAATKAAAPKADGGAAGSVDRRPPPC